MPWKKVFENRASRNRRDRNCAPEVVVIDHEDLEVASAPKKRTISERSTTPSKIKTRTPKKSLFGSGSQHCSTSSTAKSSATVAVIKKLTGKTRKAPKEKPQSPEAESRLLVLLSFDNQLSGRHPPVYTVPFMLVNNESRFWCFNCR